MATFIGLVDFTDKGIREIKDSPKRAQAAIGLAKEMGISVKDIYWTCGGHDGVLILDAPDDVVASAYFLALAKQGSVRTRTLRAYEREEFQKILAATP